MPKKFMKFKVNNIVDFLIEGVLLLAQLQS
jgi:hypothetical protein